MTAAKSLVFLRNGVEIREQGKFVLQVGEALPTELHL